MTNLTKSLFAQTAQVNASLAVVFARLLFQCTASGSCALEFGPTNYESAYTLVSDTFAYRNPHKNAFLRFAYPRVKNGNVYSE